MYNKRVSVCAFGIYHKFSFSGDGRKQNPTVIAKKRLFDLIILGSTGAIGTPLSEQPSLLIVSVYLSWRSLTGWND